MMMDLPNTCHTSFYSKKSNRQIGHIKLLENNDNKSFRFGILADDSLEGKPRFFTITNGELETLYKFLKIHETKE